MSTSSQHINSDVLEYLRQINEPEHPVLAKLRKQTQNHRLGKMAIAHEQVALLTWLARLIKAERYLEIGVFTGYSSTAMALSLPENGEITACDINVSFTNIAQTAWKEAGISHKIQLHLQPALITLDELIIDGKTNYYDIALIDADKPPTPHYFERCLQLVRSGGIIVMDNVLLNGRVMLQDAPSGPPSIKIMQEFNQKLSSDQRIIPITLPMGDGLTLVIKK